MSNRPSLISRDDDGASSGTDANDPALTLTTHHRVYFYLPKKLWSPRYESDFYSVTVTGHRVFEAVPPSPSVDPDAATSLLTMTTNASNDDDVGVVVVGGNVKKHPAVYYQVTVHRARTTTVLWRRYSQFAWLRRQWMDCPPKPSPLTGSSSMAVAPAASSKISRASPGAALLPSSSASAPTHGAAVGDGFPSACPFFWWALPEPHREAFVRQREEGLATYLDHALGSAPGYATHPATVAFLELR